MVSVVLVLLQVLSVLGWGGALLRLIGLDKNVGLAERYALAWGLGFGIVGWLVFVPLVLGHAETRLWWGYLTCGLFFLAWTRPPLRLGSFQGWDWLLVGFLVLSSGLDLIEGLAPPVDADSLAYHFARPAQIIAQGVLSPVARAVDGATPLLVQMTYVPVLALGGERALTLWAMVSGWLALLPLFAVCRLWLPKSWSLAAVALVATVPAWVYGAGSGQVEARAAAFVTLAVFALARAVQTRDWRWVLVAGMAAGFYGGAKFYGLLFAALCALVLLAHRRWWAVVVFSAAAFIAGCQWYVFHGVTLGDPLFPMLWERLPWSSTGLWDQAHAAVINSGYYGVEAPASPKWLWLLAYGVVASVAPFDIWEAGRTGLGGFLLVMAPFSLLGAWSRRRAVLRSPLAIMALTVLGFYAVWFLSGTSQRIRHLLPFFPMLVLLALVAAHHWRRVRGSRHVVPVAVAAVLLLQLGGQLVYSKAYIDRVIQGLTRDEFLRRNLIHYDVAAWINANLPPNARLVMDERQLLYMVDREYFYAHPVYQALLNLLPSRNHDITPAVASLSALGATHLVYAHIGEAVVPNVGLSVLARDMKRQGCLRHTATVTGRLFWSRTLGTGASETRFEVAAFDPSCLSKVEPSRP